VDGWRYVCCHPVRSLSGVEVITIDDRLIKGEQTVMVENDSSAVCKLV